MNSKAKREIVYEDFEPTYYWVRGEEIDTLALLLSGFRREEIKVQITSNRFLKVSGEEKVTDKRSVRHRFYREFSIPKDTEINEIGAKFKDGKLYIKFPKAITKKKPPPTHTEKADDSKAKQVSLKKKKKEEEEATINNNADEQLEKDNKKKQVWKLTIGFIVALLMLVLVIWVGVRNNAIQDYSSSLGTSDDIQELFFDV